MHLSEPDRNMVLDLRSKEGLSGLAHLNLPTFQEKSAATAVQRKITESQSSQGKRLSPDHHPGSQPRKTKIALPDPKQKAEEMAGKTQRRKIFPHMGDEKSSSSSGAAPSGNDKAKTTDGDPSYDNAKSSKPRRRSSKAKGKGRKQERRRRRQ
ncbi:hypothetical protein THAOC_16730, partial [Thalassiosira oceanica]